MGNVQDHVVWCISAHFLNDPPFEEFVRIAGFERAGREQLMVFGHAEFPHWQRRQRAGNSGWIGDRGHWQPPRRHCLIIAANSASVNTGTPSVFALSSLLPAFSPATTKSVFFETLLAVLPPSDLINSSISSR